MVTKTWKKDAYELIDYDCDLLFLDLLETQESGYIYRNKNDIEFETKQNNEFEQLLEVKRLDNVFHLRLNDFSFDETGNVSSHNSTWFLLRKKYLDEKMNEYNLKEGDILRIGRITIKIKKIKFSKNKDNNKDNKRDNKDTISINTNLNLKEIPTQKTNKKVYEKDDNQKYKICRICYLEDDTIENPLIQPCICSGSMKFIHLDCLKHWLQTSIFVKIESNRDSTLYLFKTPECELCKTKFTDYIRHKGKLYEILDFKNDFTNYLIIESLTMDKNQNKYLYVVNLDQPKNNITIGRGHDCNLLLSDISVSRWHCYLTVDKNVKKVYIHDYNSKFGTLILVQARNIVMCPDLKLCIQIGRTYLELILKESFNIFNCCGVGEKKNADFFYVQNKDIGFDGNKLTIKNDYDYDIDYINNKNKIKTDNLITRPNLIPGENDDKDEKKEEKEIYDIDKLLINDDEKSNNIIENNNILDNNIIEKSNNIIDTNNILDSNIIDNNIINNNKILSSNIIDSNNILDNHIMDNNNIIQDENRNKDDLINKEEEEKNSESIHI